MSRTQWGAELTLPVSEERDHVQGPADAAVTLVEYGDYECPYCGAAYPIVKEIQQRLGDRLRFVFRNFPITTAHPHAEHAAEAAEAAGAQGRFWEMHDYLFEHQQALQERDLHQYALDLGLHPNRFERDRTSPEVARRIDRDLASGERSGVEGTPTFYVNGVRYDAPFDVDSLRSAIVAQLSGELGGLP